MAARTGRRSPVPEAGQGQIGPERATSVSWPTGPRAAATRRRPGRRVLRHLGFPDKHDRGPGSASGKATAPPSRNGKASRSPVALARGPTTGVQAGDGSRNGGSVPLVGRAPTQRLPPGRRRRPHTPRHRGHLIRRDNPPEGKSEHRAVGATRARRNPSPERTRGAERA